MLEGETVIKMGLPSDIKIGDKVWIGDGEKIITKISCGGTCIEYKPYISRKDFIIGWLKIGAFILLGYLIQQYWGVL